MCRVCHYRIHERCLLVERSACTFGVSSCLGYLHSRWVRVCTNAKRSFLVMLSFGSHVVSYGKIGTDALCQVCHNILASLVCTVCENYICRYCRCGLFSCPRKTHCHRCCISAGKDPDAVADKLKGINGHLILRGVSAGVFDFSFCIL